MTTKVIGFAVTLGYPWSDRIYKELEKHLQLGDRDCDGSQ